MMISDFLEEVLYYFGLKIMCKVMKGFLKLGRNVDSIVERYKKFVKPCHEKYVLPVKNSPYNII